MASVPYLLLLPAVAAWELVPDASTVEHERRLTLTLNCPDNERPVYTSCDSCDGSCDASCDTSLSCDGSCDASCDSCDDGYCESSNSTAANDDPRCAEDPECPYLSDGDCDDGGVGSEFGSCVLGGDCSDCGPRAGDAEAAAPNERRFGSQFVGLFLICCVCGPVMAIRRWQRSRQQQVVPSSTYAQQPQPMTAPMAVVITGQPVAVGAQALELDAQPVAMAVAQPVAVGQPVAAQATMPVAVAQAWPA